MASKNLILYATVDGHTRKISETIVEELRKEGQETDLYPIQEVGGSLPLADYERVILGSSIRYGVHNKQLVRFIKDNREQLERQKTAFFSVNLVARKAEKSAPDTNPYVIKFFKLIDWRPTVTEVFAGMLEYPRYGFFDRIMIQLIMRITKGPTDPKTVIEYTDWDKVRAFARRLGKL